MTDERVRHAREEEQRPVDDQPPEVVRAGARPFTAGEGMTGFWLAFGRGFVKLLVSLLAGAGVALLVVGHYARDDPNFWRGREPPFGFFVGLGNGLLTVAGMLVVLFFVPWWLRKAAPPRQ